MKIVVGKKCLQKKRILNISVVKIPTKIEKAFNKNYQSFLKYWEF